ncbi:CoA transferase [Rhizobium leguminosarum]|uniref:CaiB/BaiF CoA transferase family protein n=1 Tax=Rhizobium TaxID=379 RepID=UPI001C915B40|nr:MULTISPECIES: CaiB/BaiF CoA-transferase family protein [Rhizobium]MBY3122559.1 CoA transferase [Rhizobium laguerreae]MBY3158055.1 CoA transferase [Rhizobium laguerreae]MBY3178683.1 CoA transferase [Rhizobium leguminosarum]MBY3488860.1 CoA transferase [Rhizobium laguerreae]MBY5565472.1 CoA transferase [Rhizobium leguminosarum]
MRHDLEGITVVALEQAVAAPYASSRLADAGARVIKLERHEGDFARNYDSYVNGLSAYFVWLNRGKESVLFNLKDPADVKLLHSLLATADVFIQNLAPGATDRAGIASAELRQLYPKLITVDITGYGSTGEYRSMKAYDLLVQAESGLALLTGNDAGAARVGVSVCDIACGMYAHQAILQALYAREKNGEGRGIEVSLFHSLADWMNVPYLQFQYGGHHPSRNGLEHPTIAPYGVFGCHGGEKLLLSIQNEREWQRLCEQVLERADLHLHEKFSNNNARVKHRRELEAVINSIFGDLTRDQVAERLMKAEIAFGRLSTLEDLGKHPQLRTIAVETTTGEVELIAPPSMAAGDLHFGTVPALGAHDKAVRAEFLTASTDTVTIAAAR